MEFQSRDPNFSPNPPFKAGRSKPWRLKRGLLVAILALFIGAAALGGFMAADTLAAKGKAAARKAARLFTTAPPPPPIVIEGADGMRAPFTYGSWPALANAEFFSQVKEKFLASGRTFIEANLSEMKVRLYQKGELVKEAPIISKGREGSWWETPAGLYTIGVKEERHFSSLGRVWMPWSMQFQGNFFIHGPTYFPDGTPTPNSYSGGCIRVPMDDVREIFEAVEPGTPVLVYEASFAGKRDEGVAYVPRAPVEDESVSYLVADLSANTVLAAHNAQEARSIASLTKLMTALIAVEYINVEREVLITSEMLVATSRPRLRAGERVKVLDLLSLLLLESSNEAAVAVAEPLGERYFVNLMNQKADAIGMLTANFADTSGASPQNTASAEDLFMLAKYLYHNRSFVLHMSVGNENRAAYGPAKFSGLENFNDMELPERASLVGAKVGMTKAAGNTMLSVVEITFGEERRPLAVIVLGADDAKAVTRTLVSHITDNFALVRN
ncbi:MAG: hypothetical protein KatS3mg099_421 [Candidatus Parcubacteria bacterium]|nr:MAG: hypothetical protein KatS3mg099_421 [Candidatus Parcubacteria bacterium]